MDELKYILFFKILHKKKSNRLKSNESITEILLIRNSHHYDRFIDWEIVSGNCL